MANLRNMHDLYTSMPDPENGVTDMSGQSIAQMLDKWHQETGGAPPAGFMLDATGHVVDDPAKFDQLSVMDKIMLSIALGGLGGSALGLAFAGGAGGAAAGGGTTAASAGASTALPSTIAGGNAAFGVGLAPAVESSIGAGALSAAGAGAEAGSGLASASEPGWDAAGNFVGNSSYSSVGAPAAVGSSSMLGKVFNRQTGIDPTMLALSGLSMLGGDGNQRQSFEGKGAADPVAALQSSLASINAVGQGIQNSKFKLRPPPSYSPKPVTIPGLGFQIGGGLATDPALADPTLDQENGLTTTPFGQTMQTILAKARTR